MKTLLPVWLVLGWTIWGGAALGTEVLELGNTRQLFVDDYLIDKLDSAELVLAEPKDEGVAFHFEEPWEGKYSGYATFMKVGPADYRVYYRGSPRLLAANGLEQRTCVATSKDGIHWERPHLGLHEVLGTKNNNVILTDYCHNFAPFLDKEGTSQSERFKAVAGDNKVGGLVAFSSEDGIHWKAMYGGKQVLENQYLDSLNVVFWSEAEGCYVLYGRTWKSGWSGKRWIARSTSEDFEHWTSFEEVHILHQGENVPLEHYYTNGTRPYFRAPHIYISLPGQITFGGVLSAEQIKTLQIDDPRWPNSRSGGGLMSSRGGNTFQRTFMEEFIRPPIGPENWISRCNYPASGILQTGPAEMSIYVDTHWGQPTRALRRYSLRLDGFVSLRAPFAGGQMLTKPFTFDGNKLSINYATSSRGHIRLQFETPEGQPIEGFALENCQEIIGNEIDRFVVFKNSNDLTALRGKPVRLRMAMKDADLYSFQFQK